MPLLPSLLLPCGRTLDLLIPAGGLGVKGGGGGRRGCLASGVTGSSGGKQGERDDGDACRGVAAAGVLLPADLVLTPSCMVG